MHVYLALGDTGVVRLHGDAEGWTTTEWDRAVVEPAGDPGPAA